MQAITIIIVALVTTFCVPVFLLLVSGYTLYATISMARYAKRRQDTIVKVVKIGRSMIQDDRQSKEGKKHSKDERPRRDEKKPKILATKIKQIT